MLKNLSVSLPVVLTKHGKKIVVYSPALDISTVGKDLKDARRKFEELVPLFFEELAEGGTTDDVLSELGWEKQERKKAWLPPKVLNTQSIGVRLPAFA